MKELSVEQLEWLIGLAEERVRDMVESPEKVMLNETIAQLREERLRAKGA